MDGLIVELIFLIFFCILLYCFLEECMNKKKVKNQSEEKDWIVSVKNDKNKDREINEFAILKKKLLKIEGKYLFLMAEFENYKKRVSKEKIQFSECANKEIILEFLPILDNLVHAISMHEISNENSSLSKMTIGIKMVLHQFELILAKFHVIKLKTRIGDRFNYEVHDAVQSRNIDDTSKGLIVLNIVQCGYKFKKNLIRPVKVVVSKLC